jgi:nucleotide-binding universal stress UspA family protein
MKNKLPGSNRRSAGAKGPAQQNGKGIQLMKILVPTDFSGESRKAIEYARAFAERFGARITLLHVVELESCPADFGYGPVTMEYPCKEKLKEAKTKLNALGRKVIGEELYEESLAVSGTAYAEITEAAKALETDLIIMGTHGDEGREHLPMGSTAERVVRHAHCPVFIVRRKEHEFVH